MPIQATGNQSPRGPGRPGAARAGEAREALLLAARELMTEKGLPAVTVREIAERAGVQAALVNYHFGGKEGLLRSVVDSVMTEMAQRIQQVTTGLGSIDERLRELIEGVIEALSANPYAPRLMVEQVLFGDRRSGRRIRRAPSPVPTSRTSARCCDEGLKPRGAASPASIREVS